MTDSDLIQRKNDHLDVVLDPARARSHVRNGFQHWRFEHCALPELDLDRIDLRTSLFGRPLAAPLLISSMTGGAARATTINHHLAAAAQALGIAMGVGSQRVALEGASDLGLDRRLRELAPDVPLLANLGAAQLRGRDGVALAERAVAMIEADALIVHLNPLQEALQHGGDRDWRGVIDAIAATVAALDVPVVVKEVGAGLSATVAQRLATAGVAMLDVAGAGGTSWAAVEGERARTPSARSVAMAFADWGIPTADSLVALHRALPTMPLIASGGIRDGIEVAKALRLGAHLVGQAAGTLASALNDTDAVVAHFQTLIEQLRIACFCTASADLAALREAPILRQAVATPDPASGASSSGLNAASEAHTP